MTNVKPIRADLKCTSSFRECSSILKKRQWESETSKIHFASGVRMGVGTFNLMISLLPARVIKLLEFIGFSGNKVWNLDGEYIEWARRFKMNYSLYFVNHFYSNLAYRT